MRLRSGWFMATTLAGLVLAACQSPTATVAPSGTQIFTAVPLQVYAAASLTDAFKTIGKAFETANSGTLVSFKFDGSQVLADQINQGAAADVFASADDVHMKETEQTRKAETVDVRTFVKNRLVIVQPAKPTKVLKSPVDLGQSGLKIVVGNNDVPVGRYTIQFLDKAAKDPAYGADFKTKVVANIVSYESNVRNVLDKVINGQADAGVVYLSDYVGAGKDKVTTVTIPNALNVTATYPIVALSGSTRKPMAQKFVDFVLADQSQSVLQQYGFVPAAESDD